MQSGKGERFGHQLQPGVHRLGGVWLGGQVFDEAEATKQARHRARRSRGRRRGLVHPVHQLVDLQRLAVALGLSQLHLGRLLPHGRHQPRRRIGIAHLGHHVVERGDVDPLSRHHGVEAAQSLHGWT